MFRIIVVLVSCAFLSTGAVPTHVEAASAPSWVHVDNNGFLVLNTPPPSLPSSHVLILQGQKTVNGCEFTTTVHLTPQNPRVAEQQIGIKLSTCQEMIERRLPPTANLPSGVPTAPGNGSGGPTPYVYDCGPSTAHAFQKYTDPAGINVTSQTDFLTWYYNGSYLCGTATGYDSPYGAPDGWYIDPGYNITQGTSQSGYVASHYTQNVMWDNDWFCDQFGGCYEGTTHTLYGTTQFWGNQLGQINATETHSASGCDNLLLTWYGDSCYGTGRC